MFTLCFLSEFRSKKLLKCSCSYVASCSLKLISHGTLFFSHNKTVLADLSAVKTISRITRDQVNLDRTNLMGERVLFVMLCKKETVEMGQERLEWLAAPALD